VPLSAAPADYYCSGVSCLTYAAITAGVNLLAKTAGGMQQVLDQLDQLVQLQLDVWGSRQMLQVGSAPPSASARGACLDAPLTACLLLLRAIRRVGVAALRWARRMGASPACRPPPLLGLCVCVCVCVCVCRMSGCSLKQLRLQPSF
jgi:hypothetical protein